MSDLLLDLRDLLEQATKEKSHYYTKNLIEKAINEILRLQLRFSEIISELHNHVPLEEINDLMEDLEDNIKDRLKIELNHLEKKYRLSGESEQ